MAEGVGHQLSEPITAKHDGKGFDVPERGRIMDPSLQFARREFGSNKQRDFLRGSYVSQKPRIANSNADPLLSLTLSHRSHFTLHRDATVMISQFAS